MKKKITLIALISVLLSTTISNIALSDTTDMVKAFGKIAEIYAEDMLPVLRGPAKSCTPASSQKGLLIIYGKKGNNCHLFYQGIDCNLPEDVLQKFVLSLTVVSDNAKRGYINPNSSADKTLSGIISNPQYCKIQQNSY